MWWIKIVVICQESLYHVQSGQLLICFARWMYDCTVPRSPNFSKLQVGLYITEIGQSRWRRPYTRWISCQKLPYTPYMYIWSWPTLKKTCTHTHTRAHAAALPSAAACLSRSCLNCVPNLPLCCRLLSLLLLMMMLMLPPAAVAAAATAAVVTAITAAAAAAAAAVTCLYLFHAAGLYLTWLQIILSSFWLELDPSVGTHAEVEAAQVSRWKSALITYVCLWWALVQRYKLHGRVVEKVYSNYVRVSLVGAHAEMDLAKK